MSAFEGNDRESRNVTDDQNPKMRRRERDRAYTRHTENAAESTIKRARLSRWHGDQWWEPEAG